MRDLTSSFCSCSQTKKDTQESFTVLFSPKKLAGSFILQDVKLSPDSKMLKLLTFDNLLAPLRLPR